MKKQHSVGALLLASLLGVTACAGSPEPSDVDDTGAGKLSILSIGSADSALGIFFDQFAEDNPDIEVDVTYAGFDTLPTTLRTQLAAGRGPDVFLTLPGTGAPISLGQLVPPGYLADLSDRPFSSELPASMDAMTSVDGKRYLVPVSVGAIGIVYNETAMADAGLEVPSTWSGLIDYCAAATSAGKVPFALGGQTGSTLQWLAYSLAATLVYSENPEFDNEITEGTATFEGSAWEESIDKIGEMRDAGCFQPNALSTSIDVAKEMLASGDALASVSTLGLMGIAPEGTRYIAVGVPATDNAADTYLAAGPSAGFSINADAKNPVAAQRLLDAFAAPENMATLAAVSGTFPSISSAFEVTTEVEAVAQHIDAGTIHPWMDQLWPSPAITQALIDGLQRFYGGSDTANDVLVQMDLARADS